MHHSIKFLLTPILTLTFSTNAQAFMPDDDEIPTGEDHSDSSDKTINSQAFMPEEDEIATGDGHLNSSDKSGYTLFNPTPRDLWRPMSADRPDFTESPITVDAGAVQVELSFLDYASNGDENALSVAPVNIKLGLLNNVVFPDPRKPLRIRTGTLTIELVVTCSVVMSSLSAERTERIGDRSSTPNCR